MGVNLLDAARLGEGYALFINTLNHPTNSCNAFLAGETTMMGKEHFIETFGVPRLHDQHRADRAAPTRACRSPTRSRASSTAWTSARRSRTRSRSRSPASTRTC